MIIKSVEADKISLVKELSITGLICLTITSYLLVLIALNIAWKPTKENNFSFLDFTINKYNIYNYIIR